MALKQFNLYFCCLIILLLLSGIVNAQIKCKIEHYSTEDGLSHDGVTTMLKDRDGFMWFGTWDGINRFDGIILSPIKPVRATAQLYKITGLTTSLKIRMVISGLVHMGTRYTDSFQSNHSEVLPIHKTIIDLNPNLKQDYGY